MIADVALNDRFAQREGRVLITGVQALVRLMLLQADRDKAAGLHTGGFVSGYRGSPLGTLDFAFQSAKADVDVRGIVVRPAINEELAATAVAGTQQINQTPGARVEGVFSLWYGKGPGLDRASDAIRHGNLQGSTRAGGVVLAVGDDHLAKSSTVVCHSDNEVAALRVPLLYPADAGEIVTLGLHAFAMSRVSGAWTALKIVTEVADATRAIDATEMSLDIVEPEVAVPAVGLHARWPDTALDQELRHERFRLPAAQAYARANRLDRIVLKPQAARTGIVTAGKSWHDLRAALAMLGLDDEGLSSFSLALYKPALVWPLEPETLREFAKGLTSLIVVEEKNGLIEAQIKSIFYGQPDAPAVWGKTGPDNGVLFPSIADLTPERIAFALGTLLSTLRSQPALAAAAERAGTALRDQASFAVPPAIRKPFFCSGCPHNRSTTVPQGSRALAGIGCHGLAGWNRPRTGNASQMGGEGIHWMGLSPFTDEAHLFANIGDGTYFHSGILAIRQAVAARLNITYKLLYNNAVAMTGGQPVDGELSVELVVEQLNAEGVTTIIVSTDDPDRYPRGGRVRALVERVEHRDDFEHLQLELRERPGVSVIVYDQMCATELRRLRKRGRLPDPPTRVFINPLVCEGCGDCSVKSNCLSVEPLETEFGTKRRINQSSCNKDYSCVSGFCPSFVTIEGGTPRKIAGWGRGNSLLPPAGPPALAEAKEHQRIIVAGVGGTGVVTIGALLAMAGHMRGLKVAVLDQVGLAQKGGAVTSHIHVARSDIDALRIPTGSADLILACDQIVGNLRDVIAAIEPGRSKVIANEDVSITGDFTHDRNAVTDASLLASRLSRRAGAEHFVAHPFTRLAERLLGDAIGSNLMMVGMAFQRGWLDFHPEAFIAAVELNGAAVSMNLAAFEWGRQLAVNPQAVYEAAHLLASGAQDIDELIEDRAAFLCDYQDAAYADRFRRAIAAVMEAEGRVSAETALTAAAARALFKLMAFKDEYEVARLFASQRFRTALAEQFEGDIKLTFHMAPPLLSRRDPATGHLRKSRFGPWMMIALRLLAKMKGLRGTVLDPFGRTQERRTERELVSEYEQLLTQLISGLTPENLDRSVEIAALPMEICGYGHVKQEAVGRFRLALTEKLALLQADRP